MPIQSAPRLNTLRSFGLEPLPGILGHRDTFAGPQAFEEFGLKPLLFKALQVLPDEPPDVVTRRPVVRGEAALFDELFEIFWKRDGHGACVARHRVRNSRNDCYSILPL